MSEIYTGVKFKYIRLGDIQPSEEVEYQAQNISKVLGELPTDCSSGSSGNISVKTEGGILISSSGSLLKNLLYPEHFCEVVSNSDEKRIRFFGKDLPSSETRMHLLIHEKRVEIKYCLHIHTSNITKLQILNRFPITSQFLSYGTINLAQEASNNLQSNDIVILRDHGIVIVGEDLVSIFRESVRVSSL